MGISVDVCVAQHQGDRSEQQDRAEFFAHPRLRGVALAVLADGMGGHAGGALAAEQVVHTARNNLGHFVPTVDAPRDLLANSMLEAHTMICASRFINEKDPHSTAVLLLVQPERIAWAHCGDSRLYHFRGSQLLGRTRDHSYVEHLVSSGRISPEQALVHPDRNKLMTALGVKKAPELDFGETAEPAAGDVFFLCSDGVWTYFNDAELGQVLSAHSARQSSEILLERARQRAAGSGDNLSMIIVRLC